MKTILKLAIAALIANATWRLGSAYASHYRFQDAATQASQYGSERSDDQLRAQIMDLASRFDIPIREQDLSLRRANENHTYVDGTYVRQVPLFPGYEHPWSFSFNIDTFTVKPPSLDPASVQ